MHEVTILINDERWTLGVLEVRNALMSNYFDEFDIRVLFRLHLHHFVQHLTLFT